MITREQSIALQAADLGHVCLYNGKLCDNRTNEPLAEPEREKALSIILGDAKQGMSSAGSVAAAGEPSGHKRHKKGRG